MRNILIGLGLFGLLVWLVAASPLHNPGVTTADDPVVWTGTHTNTSQPCFLAFNSVTDTDVTGAGAIATIDFDTEVFDQGADFVADTFTASVTGKYLLQVTVSVGGVTAAADRMDLDLVTSNRTYSSVWVHTNTLPTTIERTLVAIADMDALDTAFARLQGTGEASNVQDINGSSVLLTYFSGCLIS